MRLFRPLSVSCAALLLTAGAHAQLLDAVKGAVGGGAMPAAVPDLGSVGTGNIAGVLGYCAKNNYLGGDASSVKDKLLGKLGGDEKAQADPGYQEGLGGVLGGQSSQKLDLSGGGLQAQLREKVCDQVLEYGKSLL
ncbi:MULTISPECIES: DUF2501 domain-containing protein [unclassified Achromobacter]|uniref:DUF2501 domain-containing protein n=1 Tax=unclassified Achromobacter TaxID=2626865 RepID=UPI00069ED063|nr:MULTISPECIES: DUF2501 domain-containing protein [unclassified Achromobacter]KOF52713.1 hypothetical protein AD428_18450 [Achromobacter sp. DMS1]